MNFTASVARVRAAAQPALLAFAFLYVLLLVPPFAYYPRRTGLDASWMTVITYGAGQGWQWGRDILFTYGPLGFLGQNMFLPERFGYALALNSVLAGALALGVTTLLAGLRPAVAFGMLLLFAFALAGMGRVAFQVLPVVAVLLHFRGENKFAPVTMTVLAGASGLYALVYLSSGVTAVAMFGIIDVARIMQRRRPWCLAVFATAMAGGYLSAGQDLANLPDFARSVFEMISGYAGAMGSAGRLVELVAYLCASILGFTLMLVAEIRRPAVAGRRSETALMFAALGAYWFIAFKSGFVRHDLHSKWAWLALNFLMAAYVAVRWQVLTVRLLRAAIVLLALGAGSVSAVLVTRSLAPSQVVAEANRRLVAGPEQVLMQVWPALRAPERWLEDQKRVAAEANDVIRTKEPLPAVSGTVDLIPNMQSSVIAHGMEYRPRPGFQDYAVYTPWLIERNREHYRSARAADTLLFKPADIDERYPLLEQSAAILDILSRYRATGLDGNMLVMRRRAAPAPVALGPTQELSGRLGQWLPTPAATSGLLVTIDLDPTLAGRLFAWFFRPPIVKIHARTADGVEHEHRLVPGIARTGFLLSPRIDSASSFARLAYDVGSAPLAERVVSFKVDTSSESARWLYQPTFAVGLSQLSVERDAAAKTSDFGVQLRRNNLATHFAQSVGIKPGAIQIVDTELFAHAPAALSVAVESASLLRAEFGIKDGAYSGQGATDGVCFRVSEKTSAGARRLFERCLDPRARAADRSPQKIELALGGGPMTLVLETDCRGHCYWDWSYWKDIDVE